MIASCLNLLFGCTTTQLKTDFPTPPEELMIVPKDLHTLNDGATLSNVEGVIVDNYSAYHEVATQLINLENWIKEQSKIK
jgi:hypothetical protein